MKIQVRLMLVIIPVMVIVFAITSIFTSIFSTDALEVQARDNARLLSRSYSGQLDSTIYNYFNISQDLGNAVITSINVETTLQVFRRRYLQFTNVFYTPATGRVLDMSPYNAEYMDFDFSETEAWQKAFRDKIPVISEPGEYFGEQSIIIFTPAMLSYVLSQEPTVEGIIALVLPLKDLFNDLNNVTIGESGSLFVIDKEGIFLHHKEEELILSGNLKDLSSKQPLDEVSKAMTDLKTGFVTYSDNDGRKYISFSPIQRAQWSLGVYNTYSEISSKIIDLILINLFIVIGGVILGAVIMYFVVHRVVIPIEKLTIMAQKIEKGDRTITSEFDTSSEIGLLSHSINSMVFELRDHQRKLEETVEQRTIELKRTNEELGEAVEELNASNVTLQRTRDALWSEMELAHKLQTVLLPQKPSIEGYDIAAFLETTETVGGDYYDVIHAEGRDWFLIGDVSGHGVNSGLIMMMVQTSIHVALSQNPSIDPSHLLSIINKTIHNNIHKLGEKRYMTLTVFACYDHGEFVFSGAHLPLIKYKKAAGTLEVTETEGAWIGIVNDISGMNDDSKYTLDAGDSLLLYTDGITESTKKNGDYFTEKDLGDVFAGLAFLPAKDIVKGIRQEMKNLIFDDDVTIFVIKRDSIDD
ncbi:MAG: SpoIIE family protein phosphatase [Spirochaetaceae bacterium]|nr:SpoIIE family protein phosphatase [Spirochaetaceae bacterium]